MKKRMKICLYSSIILLVLMPGCAQMEEVRNEVTENAGTEEEEIVEQDYITKEYLIEKCGLSEEDLEGVDIEAMAQEYQLLKNDEEIKYFKQIILELKCDFMLDGYGFNYQYLCDQPKSDDKLKPKDIEDIKTIAFTRNDGTYYETMVFDLESKEAFFGDGTDLLKKGAIPTKEITLSAEDAEQLQELITSCKVTSWKKEYNGDTQNSTGWFWWGMHIELEDGRILYYSGKGVMGATPSTYDDLLKGLYVYFREEK